MRELITFSVPIKVVPRPSLTSNIGTAAVRYDSRTRDKYFAMKATVRGAAQAHLPADWTPCQGPIELRIVVEHPRLKTNPDRLWKLTVPDISDNQLKGLQDSLTDLVWVDDKQIVSCSIAELYGDDYRVTIQVNEMTTEGVAWVWENAGPRESASDVGS